MTNGACGMKRSRFKEGCRGMRVVWRNKILVRMLEFDERINFLNDDGK